MKLSEAVLLTSLVVVSSPSFAQSIPGPAASGWFVVIAHSESRHPGLADLAKRMCFAFVMGSEDADGVMNNTRQIFNVMQPMVPRQKIGPYPTAPRAFAELEKAGWHRDDPSGGGWSLDQKCP